MSKCLRYEDVYGPILVDGPSWNGGAVFIEALDLDGYYSFQVSKSSVGVIVGLTTDPTGEGYSNINHGLHFSRGRYRVIENGVEKYSWHSYDVNHTFHIVRDNNVVYYCRSSSTGGPYGDLPGTIFYTSQIPSFGTAYLDASLFATNDTILSASVSKLTKHVNAAGTFSLTGRAYGGYDAIAEGGFSFLGMASDTLAPEFEGFFRLEGLASGKVLTNAHGVFDLAGITADYPYATAEGAFSLVGVASNEINPGFSLAKGIFEIVGEANASVYVPSVSTGSFIVAGKSATNAIYGEALGSFRMWGMATASRPLQNYFNVRLSFTDLPPGFRAAVTEASFNDVASVSLVYKTAESIDIRTPARARAYVSAYPTESFVLSDRIRYVTRQLLHESINVLDITHEDIYRLAVAAELLSFEENCGAAVNVLCSANEDVSFIDFIRFISIGKLSENFDVTDTAASVRISRNTLLEVLSLVGIPSSHLDVAVTTTEAIGFVDAIHLIASAIAQESVEVADLSRSARLIRNRLVERLNISESLLSSVLFIQRLVESLSVNEIAAYVRAALASEVIEIADEVSSAILAKILSSEALNVIEEAVRGITVIRRATDNIQLDDDVFPSLTVSLLASDRLAFIGRLPLKDGVYSALVLNTDSLGVTSYANFPMLDFATYNGKTLAIAENGLYELDGNDDDGALINAMVETGDIDFGQNDVNVPRAFFYLWANGDIRLRTISSKRGCREDAWYDIIPVNNNVDQQARIIPLARGIRGNTWSFLIENVDGSNFSLSDTEILPVILNKKGAR